MNSVHFLYAAYTAVWLIHAAYIVTLIVRSRELKRRQSALSNQHPAK